MESTLKLGTIFPNGKSFTYLSCEDRAVKSIEAPSWASIKSQDSFKYADINYVYENSTEPIRKILEQFPVEGKHRSTIVDVKVHYLKKGMFPCLPGWHTDCTLNPWHETKNDVHHIYQVGAECYTRFLAEDFTLEFDSLVPANIKSKMNAVEHKSWTLKPEKIYRYDRFGLHAPSVASEDGMRLLIRVTETDLIRPNRRIFSNFTTGYYNRTSHFSA